MNVGVSSPFSVVHCSFSILKSTMRSKPFSPFSFTSRANSSFMPFFSSSLSHSSSKLFSASPCSFAHIITPDSSATTMATRNDRAESPYTKI